MKRRWLILLLAFPLAVALFSPPKPAEAGFQCTEAFCTNCAVTWGGSCVQHTTCLCVIPP
jgi:hypothetical protein